MAIRDYFPDEWLAAFEASSNLKKTAKKTPHAVFKLFIGVLFPFLGGSIAAFFLQLRVSENFVVGAITTIGILLGFSMSLMLFTGRGSGAESLNYDEAKVYRDKIIYLLWSQSLTLISYTMTLALGIILLLIGVDKVSLAETIALSMFIGALILCFVRTAMLPYQLIDMHTFNLKMLVETKQKQLKKELEKQKRDLSLDD